MRPPVLLLTLTAFAWGAAAPARTEEAATSLARQARNIRDIYCSRCHGQNDTAKGGFGYILNRPQLLAARLIVPGDPGGSELLGRIREGSMPPEGVKLRPTPDEIAVLEKWIRIGAPADESETVIRTFRDERDVLATIRTHLRDKIEPADRRYQRYFTLVNLHDSTDVSEQNLRLYRAAVSKLVRSLSGERDIVVPQALDPDETVLAVDLRRLGWNNDKWQQLLQRYPYGLSHQDDDDAEMRSLALEVAKLTDRECELPYVRADWFVADLGKKEVRGSDDLAEPIALLIRRYQRDLGPEDVARELGLRDAKRLQDRLGDNPKWKRFGLAPIARGAAIERQTWESRGDRTKTLFQETAYGLGLGTPYIP